MPEKAEGVVNDSVSGQTRVLNPSVPQVYGGQVFGVHPPWAAKWWVTKWMVSERKRVDARPSLLVTPDQAKVHFSAALHLHFQRVYTPDRLDKLPLVLLVCA